MSTKEKEESQPVSIGEFLEFVQTEMAYRREIRREREREHALTSLRLNKLEAGQEKLLTAMFCESDQNQFGTPGVMTTMKKMDHHIDSVCWWAKFIRKAVVGILGFIILAGSAVAVIRGFL